MTMLITFGFFIALVVNCCQASCDYTKLNGECDANLQAAGENPSCAQYKTFFNCAGASGCRDDLSLIGMLRGKCEAKCVGERACIRDSYNCDSTKLNGECDAKLQQAGDNPSCMEYQEFFNCAEAAGCSIAHNSLIGMLNQKCGQSCDIEKCTYSPGVVESTTSPPKTTTVVSSKTIVSSTLTNSIENDNEENAGITLFVHSLLVIVILLLNLT